MTGAELGSSLTLVCLYLQRYKAARHRAGAACPEAPLHSQGSSSQLLDDPKQPPATAADTRKKMNDNYGIGKEGTELSALREQALRAAEGKGELATSVAGGKSLAGVTDDVAGIMVVEEENLQEESKSIAISADCPLAEENRAAGGLLGRAVSEEEEARQREGADDCHDPEDGGGLGQNEAANAGQEAEPSSLAKGETGSLTSAGCRRSTRRKPR